MIRRAPALLAAALLALAGCARDPDSTPRAEATRQKILLFGNSAEPPSLDPHLSTTIDGHTIIKALLEGLIAYHPEDENKLEPGVAESWAHEDYLVWTFQLRHDARWSNGDPVTARDFLYSFQRMLTPQLGARYSEMLFILKNARRFNKGELDDFTKVGARAIDDHTLRIELEAPTPHFPQLLKHHAWYPVHPPTIEKRGGMGRPDSDWTRQEYVGNGPFVLAEWAVHTVIRVARNPHYWDAETVRLNEIHFFPISDLNVEDQLFDTGRLHYQNAVPPNRIPVYQKNGDPYLRMDPWLGSYFYTINVTEPPFDDARVRRALSLAVNRRAIIKRVAKGGQAPALSITPPGLEGYVPPTAGEFNPKRARELLAEAGYPDGRGFPRFSVLFNSSEAHKAIAESIAQMWKSVLGIEVDLRNQEWKTYIESTEQLDYEIARSSWIGDYPYPDTFLAIFQSSNGNNRTGWANARYDELLEASVKESDAQRRLDLLHQAETILLEEMPIIPIYFYTRIYRIDPAVKGWHPTLLDNHNYKYVDLIPTPVD